jgi:hypothetical protein
LLDGNYIRPNGLGYAAILVGFGVETSREEKRTVSNLPVTNLRQRNWLGLDKAESRFKIPGNSGKI